MLHQKQSQRYKNEEINKLHVSVVVTRIGNGIIITLEIFSY